MRDRGKRANRKVFRVATCAVVPDVFANKPAGSRSVSREMSRKTALIPSQFDAVAFDLDGVVTDTARLHFPGVAGNL